MTFRESILNSNLVYHKSCDEQTLLSELKTLNELIENPALSDSNRMDAEALLYCIRAKLYVIDYMHSDYAAEKFKAIESSFEAGLQMLLTKEYANTLNIYRQALATLQQINSFMADAVELIYKVRDNDGNPITNSTALLSSVLDCFLEKKEKADTLVPTAKIFSGASMNMIPFSEQVQQDVDEVCSWLKNTIEDIRTRSIDKMMKSYVREFQTVTNFDHAPQIRSDVINAKALVVSSPFDDELALFISSYSRSNAVKFMEIDSNGFLGKGEDFFDIFFSELKEKGCGCVFNGLYSYHDDNRSVLFARIIQYSVDGNVCFIIDKKGNKALYDDMLSVARSTTGLSAMDITFKYLTLPSFSEVTGELEEKGIISVDDYDFLKTKAAFMGYVGLNKIISMYVQQKSWKEEIAILSLRRESFAAEYLKNIPSQSQLLDLAWRDLSVRGKTGDSRREFDYDGIREVSADAVRRILCSDISLFAKCGMVVRYSLLHGDDISVWERLSALEKNERITDATRLVAKLLNTQHQPDVVLVPDDQWTVKSAGGLCCDGGKLIKYKESSAKNYNWLVKAVCHECYHAFQHTLEDTGWKSWHYTELGVTCNRVNEWAYNNANYHNIGKDKTVYMIQVLEADARTFEEDCYQQSESVYNTVAL